MPINRVWRPFIKATIARVPEEAGVYELGDVQQRVLYIGSSKSSIRSRLTKHWERQKFITRVKFFRYRLTTLWEDPRDEEHKLCRLYKKQHNGKLPPLQKKAPTASDWGF